MTVNAEQAMQAQKQKDAASYNTQLGMIYLKQGDRPRAKRKLLAALKLAPKSSEVNAAMAYYFEMTGNTKQARIFYKKALSLASNSGAQLNNYGTFLCRLGRYKQAEGYFLNAVKDVYYVNSAGAYENAGLCLAAIPDYTKARSYFVKALKQDPQRKQSLYELVKIELKQGHAEKAVMDLQNYAEMTMNDSKLLGIAIEAAHKAGKTKLEVVYKQRLTRLNHFTDSTGEKNDNSNNG
ncbi:fimbrial biogenesis and twitching motility protein PilF [Legionella maceachernii]|uniref:Fimbrial biogenesis and twitching motility protein PilF n=2 Tax=Legionellaceae TaxID=444 RepID=A0A0W0W9V7_9GAMM|nr:fimbrial biogenesis and twitching motility protein PilF [Legionella maceachernii]SJZ70601.1 type IV pilus assembly protein PilF [Legionella maceachernii]SUP02299.1 Flp pilus assembly protein TadD, contains TPR repeats [Legionella maceachernii]